ncbi:hypothetical protein A2U01_0026247, partial [Trifolium medium]|nr:hypothetical protein [Trifolium medium]
VLGTVYDVWVVEERCGCMEEDQWEVDEGYRSPGMLLAPEGEALAVAGNKKGERTSNFSSQSPMVLMDDKKVSGGPSLTRHVEREEDKTFQISSCEDIGATFDVRGTIEEVGPIVGQSQLLEGDTQVLGVCTNPFHPLQDWEEEVRLGQKVGQEKIGLFGPTVTNWIPFVEEGYEVQREVESSFPAHAVLEKGAGSEYLNSTDGVHYAEVTSDLYGSLVDTSHVVGRPLKRTSKRKPHKDFRPLLP